MVDEHTVVVRTGLPPVGRGPDEFSTHSADTRGIAGGVENRFGGVMDINRLVLKRRAGIQWKCGCGEGVGVKLMVKKTLDELVKGRQADGFAKLGGSTRIITLWHLNGLITI